jgi:glycosyltransferase involved in cell wall biosynthesis
VPRSSIVFVTQQIDPDHPNLAGATSMVRALAASVDEVAVLALRAVPGALPANCTVHTFGAPAQALRGARFAAALTRELVRRPLAVVAHMSPVYAVLAAPLARPVRVPVILWFTHWRTSRTLRLAERMSSAVATVDASSFPFASPKVHAIGHGIDVSEFPCRPEPDAGPLRALVLGRTSPAKGLEAVIAGVRLARSRGVDVELEIRGPSETAEERAHRELLLSLAGDGVRVEQPVSHRQLPGVFARADLLVNAAAAGSLDKSVFEACASCVPVLASNPGFAGLLSPELLFTRGDAEQVAARLASFAALGGPERTAIGHELRRQVEQHHSTESWARGILALARLR